MRELNAIYNPLTATPFVGDDYYREYEPCEALKPYVRCFWGSRRPYVTGENKGTGGLVIPDTCMDLIFDVNFTENRIESGFCGIDDVSFFSEGKGGRCCEISTFAIRFYAWSAVLFSEESMRNVRNGFFDAGEHFSHIKKEILPLLFDFTKMEERIPLVEAILLKHLRLQRKNRIFTDCTAELLKHRGNLRMDSLASEVHVSTRQIERVFGEYMGLTPKSFACLVRYQSVWRDALYRKDFNLLDAVSEFGYTDQAHLLHDFKKYHGVTLREAVASARKDVGFLQ
ncbi:MAG: AraC family transcriptional regulator [Roseburia sp.]|nr:AraC family transcriptional regulator [Roseburia sp.]